MKRWLIDLLLIAVAIFSGVVWSQHDQSEYAERLDYLGLTENAVVYHSKSKTSAQTALTAVQKVGLTDYQIQFQQSKLTYLYATGNTMSLPLTSGQWFSDRDFKSQLPVAVAGKALVDRLYAGGSQRYFNDQGQYIPVIGIMSTHQDSQLNNRMLLTPSAPSFAKLALKDVTVAIDAPNLSRHTKALQKIFKVKSTKLHYGTANNSWLQQNAPTLAWCSLLILVTLGLGGLMSYLWRPQVLPELSAVMQRQYVRGLWFKLLQHGFVALLIGTVFSLWRFYLTNGWRLAAFNFTLWLWFAAICWFGLRQFERKEEHRETT